MTRLPGSLLSVVLLCTSVSAQRDRNGATGDASLQTAALPAQLRSDIVAAIARDFADQARGEPSGRAVALGSWVSFPRLSQTGAPAILVSSGPDDPNNGATGNGEVWLFRRVGNHAVLILKGGGYSAAATGKTFHKGMLDFKTAWNLSCCSGSYEVYRYDGARYKPAYCFDYDTDEDGNLKDGPKNRCREE